MKRKNVKAKVMKTMTRNMSSRDNDNLLIAKVLKDLYGTSDMEEVAMMTNESITETITRLRRKIQQSNPLMASSKNCSKRRRIKEQEFRTEMRGI